MSDATFSEPERGFLRWVRVARLATVGPNGLPHTVPVCPALDGDRIVFASEAKTAKVRNMRANPRVALVYDDYVEDWNALRQVLVQGTARIVESGARWERGRRLLYQQYLQYEPLAAIAEGDTVIVEVTADRVVSSGLDGE